MEEGGECATYVRFKLTHAQKESKNEREIERGRKSAKCAYVEETFLSIQFIAVLFNEAHPPSFACCCRLLCLLAVDLLLHAPFVASFLSMTERLHLA